MSIDEIEKLPPIIPRIFREHTVKQCYPIGYGKSGSQSNFTDYVTSQCGIMLNGGIGGQSKKKE